MRRRSATEHAFHSWGSAKSDAELSRKRNVVTPLGCLVGRLMNVVTPYRGCRGREKSEAIEPLVQSVRALRTRIAVNPDRASCAPPNKARKNSLRPQTARNSRMHQREIRSSNPLCSEVRAGRRAGRRRRAPPERRINKLSCFKNCHFLWSFLIALSETSQIAGDSLVLVVPVMRCGGAQNSAISAKFTRALTSAPRPPARSPLSRG